MVLPYFQDFVERAVGPFEESEDPRRDNVDLGYVTDGVVVPVRLGVGVSDLRSGVISVSALGHAREPYLRIDVSRRRQFVPNLLFEITDFPLDQAPRL